MNTRRFAIASLALVLFSGIALAGLDDKWLHVRVQDHDHDGELVAVNVPLGMVEALLPAIQTDELRGGRLLLDEFDLEGINLREILEAVQEAPDADFVRVKDHGDEVRVSKDGGLLLIDVDERHGDNVRVRLPLEVVDALLGNDPDELDLIAALEALADYDDDLVTIDSDDTSVRIWIDSSNDGE
ncbi:MAG: hypothetical protein GY716_21525 [bacterium]|nr:hypothetical protein [bacterium]